MIEWGSKFGLGSCQHQNIISDGWICLFYFTLVVVDASCLLVMFYCIVSSFF